MNGFLKKTLYWDRHWNLESSTAKPRFDARGCPSIGLRRQLS